ncbi:hypothetical protein AAFN85_13780 [Mucilaginibacter sp. CAU 1740]|uniref:hypothetical protein n=1 Tax=Mucilaginibacter sp. CAU 1740 TaxID=3140365 RepID=UPI00325C3433
MESYPILEFINTSEAYSKSVFLSKETIIIPYVNINLLTNNPVNGINCFVDFSFLVFQGVASILFEGSLNTVSLDLGQFSLIQNLNSEKVVVGGYTVKIAELEVIFDKCFWYVPKESRFSEKMADFIPCDTPNFRATLPEGKIQSFFSENNIALLFDKILAERVKKIVFD